MVSTVSCTAETALQHTCCAALAQALQVLLDAGGHALLELEQLCGAFRRGQVFGKRADDACGAIRAGLCCPPLAILGMKCLVVTGLRPAIAAIVIVWNVRAAQRSTKLQVHVHICTFAHLRVNMHSSAPQAQHQKQARKAALQAASVTARISHIVHAATRLQHRRFAR